MRIDPTQVQRWRRAWLLLGSSERYPDEYSYIAECAARHVEASIEAKNNQREYGYYFRGQEFPSNAGEVVDALRLLAEHIENSTLIVSPVVTTTRISRALRKVEISFSLLRPYDPEPEHSPI